MQFGMMGTNQQSPAGCSSGGPLTMPQIVADTDDTSSESEAEARYDTGRRHNLNTSVVPQTHENPHPREVTNSRSGHIQTPGFTGRFMICSTPIPAMNQFTLHKPVPPISINGLHTPVPPISMTKYTPAAPIPTFDQGTQTASALTAYSPTAMRTYTKREIDQMEFVVKGLYKRFLSLVTQLNAYRRRPLSLSMYPANDSVSVSDHTEQMESEPERGTRSSLEQDVNTTGESNGFGSNLRGSIKGEFIPNQSCRCAGCQHIQPILGSQAMYTITKWYSIYVHITNN